MEIKKKSKSIQNILIIEQDISFSERVLAGHYDWVNDSIIDSNFPEDFTSTSLWEFKIIPINKSISFDEAKKICEEKDWQAANIIHLLSYGEIFPENQKDFPIAALGSICRSQGSSCISILCSHNTHRILTLRSRKEYLSNGFKILSVRKIYSF